MALTNYITFTRRLLHDAAGKYFTDAELTSDINQARNRIGLDTGNVRGLFNFNLSANQEVYPYSGAVASLTITNAGTSYTAAPTVSFSGGGGSGVTASAAITSGTVSGLTITANGTGYTAAPSVTLTGGTAGTAATATASIMMALDINSITVNFQNSWYMLDWRNFTVFQSQARYWRSTTGQPQLWTEGPPSGTGGGRSFYIFYIPDISYQCDIDAIVTPNALIDDTTSEQLSFPSTDLVPYYAAFLASFNKQNFDEANKFFSMYQTLLVQGKANSYQRRIPTAYGGLR